jgi:hypothetical protein
MRHCLPAFFLALWMSTGALAQTTSATEENTGINDQGKPFANTWRIKGDVFASSKPGTSRKLKVGSPIYVGEQIRAGTTGEAVFKTADNGLVAVRPGAEFIPEQYAAQGQPTDRQVLRLITGSLRLITGWITQFNREQHRVITPSATIGIRGTDHEPYVLPLDRATDNNLPGTYDKVNRGATALGANGGNLLIESGKVGFARDPNSTPTRTRALVTLLLPTLLAKVPDFYVPGAFDAELDRYSANADAATPRPVAESKPATKEAAPPIISQAKPTQVAKPKPTLCTPQAIGEYWLDRLDQAILNREIKTILGVFAPEIIAHATVRQQDGSTQTISLNRDEVVQSTLNSIANLKNYQQRRITIEAGFVDGSSEANCRQINVQSVVIEQGLLNNQPYRFESTEHFRLEQRGGEWLAIEAKSIQH